MAGVSTIGYRKRRYSLLIRRCEPSNLYSARIARKTAARSDIERSWRRIRYNRYSKVAAGTHPRIALCTYFSTRSHKPPTPEEHESIASDRLSGGIAMPIG